MTDKQTDDIFALCSRFDLDQESYRVFSNRAVAGPLKEVQSLKEAQSSPIEVTEPSHDGAVESHTTRAALKNLWRNLVVKNDAEPARDFQDLLTTSIFVYGAAGGVGSTTVIATLARLLAKNRRNCAVVDGCEKSLVPFFFGGHPVSYGQKCTAGLRTASESSIRIISRDTCESFAEAGQHLWYQKSITQMPGALHHMLVDVTHRESANVEPYLNTSVALVVAVPDVSSIVGALALKRNLAEKAPASSVICVLNKFERAIPLHTEIRDWFEANFQTVTLSRSDLVNEALAEGLTPVDWAPESSLAGDFEQLLKAVMLAFSRQSLAGHVKGLQTCQ